MTIASAKTTGFCKKTISFSVVLIKVLRLGPIFRVLEPNVVIEIGERRFFSPL